MPTDEPIAICNDTPAQEYEVTVGCSLLWSQAQEFSYLRLSDKNGDNEYELIGLYAVRARRIAATYARFYLETEDGGDPSKLGRYYWMALGAFASKTVACLLELRRVRLSNTLGRRSMGTFEAHEIAEGLGKGNLWLFSDIAPPHWFYNHYPEHFFDGMACIHERSADSLEEPVQSTLYELPWASESLKRIQQLNASDDLIKGFEYVADLEQTRGRQQRLELQFDHLMAIANHEQGEILQPLIYDDEIFSSWTKRQRENFILRWASPKFELTFTHQCTEKDEDLRSEAPKGMVVEDFESRMTWIEQVAEMFHNLMQNRTDYMTSELTSMSEWVNYGGAD
ncbi:DUF2515 family protein [Marinimicrobium alkaliphilum]|uniref:DUF2515 family protein n=1 Tax=Marinimicrobium alkaliphilum TaxID=2202654 RepID=UPI000DBA7556|nr:hypothetical protein [Marinimicrobium alkaliphilum]